MTDEPAEGDALTDAERDALMAELGGCPFDENVNDGSMCRCGIPALGHDEAVFRIIMADHPTVARLAARTSAATGGALTDAEAYYREHGWSGCAGSEWSRLTQATQDGWAHAARLAAHTSAAVEQAEQRLAAVPQRILNTVDPLGPGHVVRMECVSIVRAALDVAPSPQPVRLRVAAALPRVPGLDNDEPETVALRSAIYEAVIAALDGSAARIARGDAAPSPQPDAERKPACGYCPSGQGDPCRGYGPCRRPPAAPSQPDP